jgi:hypothetical protein
MRQVSPVILLRQRNSATCGVQAVVQVRKMLRRA